jgi:hypothetical protein
MKSVCSAIGETWFQDEARIGQKNGLTRTFIRVRRQALLDRLRV